MASSELNFLINTHRDYAVKTMRHIVPSLLQSGVKPENLYVVKGGMPSETEFTFNGVWNELSTANNAIDWTAFVTMYQRPDSFPTDDFFFMHDTCLAGKLFRRIVTEGLQRLGYAGRRCLRLVNHSSGGMGYYKKRFILDSFKDPRVWDGRAEVLLTPPSSREEVLRYKEINFALEDILFKIAEDMVEPSPPGNWICSKKVFHAMIPFYDGVPRMPEAYPEVDLVKMKSNFWHGENNFQKGLIGA
jgi:hypothetical protein